MKTLVIINLIMLFCFEGTSQVSKQDRLALQIPEQSTYSTNGITSYVKEHFLSDSERIRALFVWVANNISYDVEKLRTKNEERVTTNDVLSTRKAVCQGYAELFVALCRESNIKSMLVGGYTKKFDGTISEVPHAWVAAELNNQWYLFDPTWAAGSVKDYQFSRRFSNRYYKVLPEEMIKDHMPIDPMYQFLNHTRTYNEFNKGNVSVNTSKPFFNYVDSINHHNRLDSFNQLISAARRINSNGQKNEMIVEALRIIKKNQETFEKNKESRDSKSGYDGAIVEFKKATGVFSNYIKHKNTRFSSIKNDKEIQQMIDSIFQYLSIAKLMIKPVVPTTEDHRRALDLFNSNFDKFYARVNDEKVFLKSYLAKKSL